MNRSDENTVHNTDVKKKYRWINDIEPVFLEDSKRNYGHRTWANAEWSDITLALTVWCFYRIFKIMAILKECGQIRSRSQIHINIR